MTRPRRHEQLTDDPLIRKLMVTPDLLDELAAIDNALRNGSYMTNANIGMDRLCARFGIDRDALSFDPQWAQLSEDH